MHSAIAALHTQTARPAAVLSSCRLFSTAASSVSAAEPSVVPADSAPLNNPRVPPINERYPDGISITRRVLDVLKSGPKTRKQIYYALNRGQPLPLPPVKPKQKLAPWVLNKDAQAALTIAPHAYPTGILRNPTHLRRILQSLLRGKRLKALPAANVQNRLGEAEKSSIQSIVAANPFSSSLLSSTAVRGADGKLSESWVYVLRDWSDKGFAAKGEARMAARAAKIERQRLRQEAKIAEANEQGIRLPLGRVPQDSRRVRHKKALAKAKADYEVRVGEATAAYRVAVMDSKTDGQPTKLGGDAGEHHAALSQIVSRQLTAMAERGATAEEQLDEERKIRANAYRYMIHDSEEAWLIKLRSDQPKIRDATIKDLTRRRNKLIQRYTQQPEVQQQ